MDWEIAKWAKLRGPGSNACSELLQIPGLCEALGLSYENTHDLNHIIDNEIPNTRPRFKRGEITAGGITYDVYFRDIIECVKALFGDPEFAPILIFAPEKHYSNKARTEQLFHDMHTGKWWWTTQAALEKLKPGATIIPIILSSDKTNITVFGGKSAYPVYITIGNIPKDIRHKPSRCP